MNAETSSTSPTSGSRSGSGGGRLWRWCALALALGIAAFYAYQIRHWLLDDAFISFRYAENLSRGDGPVFNVGERVEGYTTFLWVALLALFHRVGFESIEVARWLGALSTIAAIVLLAFTHRFVRGADAATSSIATLLLGSSACFTSWTLSGMEVPLTGSLVLAALAAHLREDDAGGRSATVASGLLCALATMARPESVLVAGCLLAARSRERVLAGRHGWLLFATAYSALYGPYFLWRWSYYGWFLPNTFYAKVGSTWDQVVRGMDYFTRWSGATFAVLAVAAAAALIWTRLAERHARVGVVPVVVAVHVAYVVAVGGDGQAAFRFFATMMPLLCLLAAIGVRSLVVGRLKTACVTAAIVALNVWQTYYHPEMKAGVLRDKTAARGEVTGRWLRENSTPDMVIATNTAGTIPYFSGLRAIDMLGLNDSHIAHREVEDMGSGIAGHEKADGAYVLSRRPDYIMFDSAMGSRRPRRPSDEELFGNPEFHAAYTFRRFRITPTRQLGIYVRNAGPES